jgi:hypothetical protein
MLFGIAHARISLPERPGKLVLVPKVKSFENEDI